MSALELPPGLKVRYIHDRKTVPFQGTLKFDSWGGYSTVKVEPRGGRTIARIIDESMDATVAEGVARCNSKDNYNKAIGRRIALGRALKALGSTAFHASQSTEERLKVAMLRKQRVRFFYVPQGQAFLSGRHREALPLKFIDMPSGPAVRAALEDSVYRTYYLAGISDVEPID